MSDLTNYVGALAVLGPPPTPSLRLYRLQADTEKQRRPTVSIQVASLAGEGGFVENALKLEAIIEGFPGDTNSQEAIWDNCVSDNIRECVFTGINASVIALGTALDKRPVLLDPDHGLLQKVFDGIQPTQKMKSMGAELTSTFTCLEINCERVRDILAKDKDFSERKVRGARPYVDGLKELPLTPENVACAQSQELKDEHSTLIINIFFKLKDCGIIKNSCVVLALIPRHLERPINFSREGGGGTPSQRLAAGNVSKVIHAITEQAKKKKGFVPYKDSIVTLMLSEPLGNGSFKTFLVGCLSEECYEVEAMKEENIAVIKMLSKARAVSMSLRSNEEEVSLLDIKSEMATLKKKLMDVAKPNESGQKMKEDTLEIQNTLKQQLDHLEATRAEKNAEYAKLKVERELRDEELRRIQEVLNSKKLAAADAIKAQEELEMLERYQDETDRKMIEEERLRIEREAELQEALELEAAITQMKKEQEEREAEARVEEKRAQESTMVALFRAAHNLTRDRAAMVSVKNEISQLMTREEELEAELLILETKARLASNHRYSMKAMSETCEEQEAKIAAARDEAQAVHDDHVKEYTSLVEEMDEEVRSVQARIVELCARIGEVSEELAKKRTEDKAVRRKLIKDSIASLNEKSDALRLSADEDRQRHTTAFQALPGQRRQVNKVKMSVRAQELTQEDLDRDYNHLVKEVAELEQLAQCEEARLESDLKNFELATAKRQELVNERAFLSRNHQELEKYVTDRNTKLGEFDREALQAALSAESSSQCSSRANIPRRSPRSSTPNNVTSRAGFRSTPATPRATSRGSFPRPSMSIPPSSSLSPKHADPTPSPTTGHPMRNASALLRRINTQVEKRHPPTPSAHRLQL